MGLKSINPYNHDILGETPVMDSEEVREVITCCVSSQKRWKDVSIKDRSVYVRQLSSKLREQKEGLSRLITKEMGKPLSESEAEIEKCAWLCEYYAENAEEFLSPQHIATDARKSYVQFDPLGVVLGVMPWNFPFWQVFRFAVPTILAGNSVIVKHASNVSMCAAKIAELFNDANIPKGLYEAIYIPGSRVEEVIKSPYVKAVSLTGSEAAGSAVAGEAGKLIKPSLLELGGSNAFIVTEDADIDLAVEKCLTGRMLNSGQSCIAAKRLIVHNSVFKRFEELYVSSVKQIKKGDPLDPQTQIGPLAKEELAIELEKQLKRSLEDGCQILVGGTRIGAFFEPTVVKTESTDTAIMQEETFGPLAVIISYQTFDEALSILSSNQFGLGTSIFTSNPEKYKQAVQGIEEGAVFFNEIVKSDPRLPFGGVGISGYGRELGEAGIKSFVNMKTVYIA